MKITWGRWIAACVVGCALVGVALLPPPDDSDSEGFAGSGGQIYNWGLARFKPASLMGWRASARENHARVLWRSRRYRLLQETAVRVFPQSGAQHSETSVWFDASVPELQRRRVSELVAEEQAERGEWRGHAGVGVIVALDSSALLGNDLEQSVIVRMRGYSTEVIAPAPQTGGRCVVAVRLGASPDRSHTVLPARPRLMDACAFYDAFGAPGAQITTWLETWRFQAARVLALTEPHDTVAKPRARGVPWEYFDPYSVRCAGGDQGSCLRVMGFDWPTSGRQSAFEDHAPTDLVVSSERFDRGTYYDYSYAFARDWSLGELARDLGPARFAKVWQSAKPFPEAYLDVSGEPLALWIQRRILAEHGSIEHATGEDRGAYHIGAGPTAAATLIILLALATAFGFCARIAPRPYAN